MKFKPKDFLTEYSMDIASPGYEILRKAVTQEANKKLQQWLEKAPLVGYVIVDEDYGSPIYGWEEAIEVDGQQLFIGKPYKTARLVCIKKEKE